MKTDTKNELSFDALRAANVRRCEEVFHPLAEWSPTDWATALGGETGEALNFVKKLRRLDGADRAEDTRANRSHLTTSIGFELADIVIYADLLAARLGLDLGEYVKAKFNLVSEERDSTHFLNCLPVTTGMCGETNIPAPLAGALAPVEGSPGRAAATVAAATTESQQQGGGL